jgi:thioredoxin-like negative regulator of GroEL
MTPSYAHSSDMPGNHPAATAFTPPFTRAASPAQQLPQPTSTELTKGKGFLEISSNISNVIQHSLADLCDRYSELEIENMKLKGQLENVMGENKKMADKLRNWEQLLKERLAEGEKENKHMDKMYNDVVQERLQAMPTSAGVFGEDTGRLEEIEQKARRNEKLSELKEEVKRLVDVLEQSKTARLELQKTLVRKDEFYGMKNKVKKLGDDLCESEAARVKLAMTLVRKDDFGGMKNEVKKVREELHKSELARVDLEKTLVRRGEFRRIKNELKKLRDDADDLRESKAATVELEKKVVRMEKLGELKEDVERLRNDLQKSEATREDLAKTLVKRDEFGGMKDEVKKVREELQKFEAARVELEEFGGLKDEVERLRNDLRKSEAARVELAKTVVKRDEFGGMKNKVKKLGDDLRESEAARVELTKTLVRRDEFGGMKNDVKKLRDELQKSESARVEMEKEHWEHVKDLSFNIQQTFQLATDLSPQMEKMLETLVRKEEFSVMKDKVNEVREMLYKSEMAKLDLKDALLGKVDEMNNAIARLQEKR